jgi:hypothetical protein
MRGKARAAPPLLRAAGVCPAPALPQQSAFRLGRPAPYPLDVAGLEGVVRQACWIGQRAQIALARATCLRARPAPEMGKNKSGSAVEQAASDHHEAQLSTAVMGPSRLTCQRLA